MIETVDAQVSVVVWTGVVAFVVVAVITWLAK